MRNPFQARTWIWSPCWNSYGADVTIVEMLPHLVPLEDEEVSVELEKNFKKRGINFLMGHKVESVEATQSGIRIVVAVGGETKTLEAEQTLVAISFRLNSKGLDLKELGVCINKRGFIEIDDCMATNVPSIWAIGDVTGKLMLAHVGSAMSIVAAEHIAGHETVTLDYEMMPRAAYCQAASCVIRLDRSAGQRARLQCEDWAIPLPNQRQSTRTGTKRVLLFSASYNKSGITPTCLCHNY